MNYLCHYDKTVLTDDCDSHSCLVCKMSPIVISLHSEAEGRVVTLLNVSDLQSAVPLFVSQVLVATVVFLCLTVVH